MNKIPPVLFCILLGLVCCKENKQQTNKQPEFVRIVEEAYELYQPGKQTQAVLVLFGGYPEVARDIKREFEILEIAQANDIAVILSNYNQKLWLEESEKHLLATSLQQIFEDHQLPTDQIFIGGFSSGGVVSLLISNYIVGLKQFYIDPKGVFIVDSPIDLAALYASSEKNIARDFSKVSTQESQWLLETLGNKFGKPESSIDNYEDNAVFTFSTNHTSNLNNLINTKIRLYTEPDTLWWKKHRMADYEQTNAFYIQKLSECLKNQGFQNVEYIPTINKGYRANGERHPHSWSIVEKKDLINWILSK